MTLCVQGMDSGPRTFRGGAETQSGGRHTRGSGDGAAGWGCGAHRGRSWGCGAAQVAGCVPGCTATDPAPVTITF